ncbi:hypothetical protein QBC45DRAFT_461881, partial [Copromyces sp. CBS 386.78]
EQQKPTTALSPSGPKTKKKKKKERRTSPAPRLPTLHLLPQPFLLDRYAVPFPIVPSVMHRFTCMNQCLYYTEVNFMEVEGITSDKSKPTGPLRRWGTQPTWAMFWMIVLGTLSWVTTILGLAVLGRYPAGMPIIGGGGEGLGYSAGVTAAACHAPLGRRGPSETREREGREGRDVEIRRGGERCRNRDGDMMEERRREIRISRQVGPLSWG